MKDENGRGLSYNNRLNQRAGYHWRSVCYFCLILYNISEEMTKRDEKRGEASYDNKLNQIAGNHWSPARFYLTLDTGGKGFRD